MTLERLTVHQLRNIRSVDLRPSPAINLIYGQNGSGKTSLLEAINVLSVGRSFRSHKIKALINAQEESLTVFGQAIAGGVPTPIGVSRGRDGLAQLKVAGRAAQSTAELASLLPLQIVNADAFSLLEGSPKIRRQFLDWLVFHVEPNFYRAWKGAQRCLKHRNTMLRHGRITTGELGVWDRELVELSETIHTMRARCFKAFEATFSQLVTDFLAVEGLTLSLYRGWDRQQDYTQLLQQSLERDLKLGYTVNGIHRADIRIRINGMNAAEILSRGQQKLLVCAFKIAQGFVFEELTGRRCIYLVDDLPAELDEEHRSLLVQWLERLATQVFITGVERGDLERHWRELTRRDIKVFHVEHGCVNNEETVSGEAPEAQD